MKWMRTTLITILLSVLFAYVGISLIYSSFEFGVFILVAPVIFALISFGRFFLWLLSYTNGKAKTILYNGFWGMFVSLFFGIAFYALRVSNFDLSDIDWITIFSSFFMDATYWITVIVLTILFHILYYGFICRGQFSFAKKGLRGKGKLGQIDANLENSRWMTDAERDKVFNSYKYTQLKEIKKDGVPMRAIFDGKKDLNLTFISPCHSLIIGSTGSGKTTTFINPMIQLLAATSAGSSMLITDPKGELFSLHSKFLAERGYDVKVLDLRDTYHSYRWNPLEPLWDMYQEYAGAPKMAFEREDDVTKSDLKLTAEPSRYGKIWYEFDGRAFDDFEKMLQEVKIFRAQKFDEMYEDMNDLVSVLVPIANQNDPMWEKGARAITMGVLLAMLEDSETPELGMTKEKFNLFNMAKILQNSDDDYKELRNYFVGRNPLSKAVANAKQVIDAADKTRSSYMSVLLEKLSLFNDSGICALTSESDFKISDLAERPTAFFVKIPDEKDTRHGLASIFMTNVYKSLIKVSSSREDLSLPRSVYYILDEFGNMPKIEKFDKMITVGRSRKIWFNMVVQSYTQLNNVYGDTVADIVKGNCGVKMFIGSNDMGTCKEFSELCGNVTVVTQGSSSSGKDNTSYSQSIQTRPLIYPSELQKLNNKTSTGNSIIVTFGNNPLKTNFTPSYKVPLYRMGQMEMTALEGRYFDESAVFYDVAKRNQFVFGE